MQVVGRRPSSTPHTPLPWARARVHAQLPPPIVLLTLERDSPMRGSAASVEMVSRNAMRERREMKSSTVMQYSYCGQGQGQECV